MKIIPTSVHGVLDYIVALALIVAPWLFGFIDDRPASIAAIGTGAVFLFSSLFTNYEAGLIKMLPMTLHLIIDFIGGVFLAASPWLLGFEDRVYRPHVVVGAFAILASLITSRQPAGTAAPRLPSVLRR
jgi:hypothetical protein